MNQPNPRTSVLLLFCIGMCFVTIFLANKVKILEAELASKPEEHSELKQDTSIRKEIGPIRIVKEFAPHAPGDDCKPSIVRIVEDRGPVVTNQDNSSSSASDVKPVAPIPQEKKRIVGLTFDILDPKRIREVHAGYMIFSRVDVLYSFAFSGPQSQRHGVSLSYRF